MILKLKQQLIITIALLIRDYKGNEKARVGGLCGNFIVIFIWSTSCRFHYLHNISMQQATDPD